MIQYYYYTPSVRLLGDHAKKTNAGELRGVTVISLISGADGLETERHS